MSNLMTNESLTFVLFYFQCLDDLCSGSAKKISNISEYSWVWTGLQVNILIQKETLNGGYDFPLVTD
jgi:hypothetical protein